MSKPDMPENISEECDIVKAERTSSWEWRIPLMTTGQSCPVKRHDLKSHLRSEKAHKFQSSLLGLKARCEVSQMEKITKTGESRADDRHPQNVADRRVQNSHLFRLNFSNAFPYLNITGGKPR
jgi:hypothetical protein